MENYILIISVATIGGFIARVILLKVDYRQYPSYPQSFLSHLVLGFISASLGAVFTPAFISRDFTAVTFLTLAASQFREIRNMERQALANIEVSELVPRGSAYIEDISKKFEARNYAVMICSFVASTFLYIGGFFLNDLINGILGFFICLGAIIFLDNFMKNKSIGDIASVSQGEIKFLGPLLMVDGVVIMNIGQLDSQDIIKNEGVGIVISPKDKSSMITLSNVGQRQAIIHNLSVKVGIRKDVDEPDFTPIARRNSNNGNISVIFLPLNKDINEIIKGVCETPVLESAKEGMRKK